MSELSGSQRRVLEWLAVFPSVKLMSAYGEVTWSAAWANEVARRSLTNFIDVVGWNTAITRPTDLTFLDWGTPPCSARTFKSLFSAGWLRKVAPHVTDQFGGYYQLSQNGVAVLERERALGIPVEQTPERASHKCECGQVMQSVGAHASSKRHREWENAKRIWPVHRA